jgi:hypothetical protein
MGMIFYIGVGTSTLIATIPVMFYCDNKMTESIKSIEESRKNTTEYIRNTTESRKRTAEYSDMLQASQRETIRILSEFVASKVENAT